MTKDSRASARILETFGEGEEESHLIVEPTHPARIMVHKAWDVPYDTPHSSGGIGNFNRRGEIE